MIFSGGSANNTYAPNLIIFFIDLDAQSDFDKKFATKEMIKWNHSHLKYALGLSKFGVGASFPFNKGQSNKG